MQAKEPLNGIKELPRPLLMVDIDGVISLFGGWEQAGWTDQSTANDVRAREGSLHSIDGTLHFLSSTAAAHLLDLSAVFDLVWASGWEERANEHLPHLLGLPPALPFLRFSRDVGARVGARAHWKLEAIDAFAGERALAWVDDALNADCHTWAQARQAPTLLVQTAPERGLTDEEALQLRRWADELARTG
jgi:hypothetical protein